MAHNPNWRSFGRLAYGVRAIGVLACVLLALTTTVCAEVLRIVHPRTESIGDSRADYPLAILRLALERAGEQFELHASPASMQQSRSLRLLMRGEHLDVVWSVTSAERERHLRPIRIPIDRGLIGWRLLLIRAGDEQRFSSLRTLADLAPLLGGQGHDWPDLPVLRANGLRVAASPTYEGLFAMLERGRIDYFPRSISEIVTEQRAHPTARIEPTLVLAYPSALYFFVHPDNQRLAAALERGLEAAIADGSLTARFNAEYGATIEQLALGRRRVITLANPELPVGMPLARGELWFRP